MAERRRDVIQETPVAFGDRHALSGILLEPGRPCRDVAMIFLNAGIVHRVGPNRSHVTLARSLAEHGFASLRFDLSGIGESEFAATDAGHGERVLGEVRAAMRLLEERLGIRKFALFGICSGADNGLAIVRVEPRVVGAVLAELYSADSPSYELRRKVARAFYARTWSRAFRDPALIVRGLTSIWSAPQPPPEGMETPISQDRLLEDQAWQDVVRDVQEACRTRRILLVYSRHDVSYHNFRKLLSRRLATGPALQVAVIGGTNHTFAPLDAADRLTSVVVDWMRGFVDADAAARPAFAGVDTG